MFSLELLYFNKFWYNIFDRLDYQIYYYLCWYYYYRYLLVYFLSVRPEIIFLLFYIFKSRYCSLQLYLQPVLLGGVGLIIYTVGLLYSTVWQYRYSTSLFFILPVLPTISGDITCGPRGPSREVYIYIIIYIIIYIHIYTCTVSPTDQHWGIEYFNIYFRLTDDW